MPPIFVKLNHPGVEAVLKSAGVARELERRARNVAAAAQADPHDVSGAYEASIQVLVEEHPTRVVAHIKSESPYAMQVEAKYGVLARALDAAR